MKKSALLSECGKYRWRLERDLEVPGPVYAFFGVNPSTADHQIDDQTVKKWIGFTRTWGGGSFIVGNLFAYRATDVKELRGVQDMRHEMNMAHLVEIIADADILVPCWGARGKIPKELHHHIGVLKGVLMKAGKPVKHLGLTASGDPTHPQMLGYSTPLNYWEFP